MVDIENKQTHVQVNTLQLSKDAQYILGLLNYSDYDLGIWLVTNHVMQEYNKKYRDKDEPTDVLSFPYHKLKPGERIVPKTDDDKNLGDIIMAPEFVYNKYPDNHYAHLQKLLVHSVCHLLGYDHDTEETDKLMLEMEVHLLDKLPKF